MRKFKVTFWKEVNDAADMIERLVEAPDAIQAVDKLGIRHKDVIEVKLIFNE